MMVRLFRVPKTVQRLEVRNTGLMTGMMRRHPGVVMHNPAWHNACALRDFSMTGGCEVDEVIVVMRYILGDCKQLETVEIRDVEWKCGTQVDEFDYVHFLPRTGVQDKVKKVEFHCVARPCTCGAIAPDKELEGRASRIATFCTQLAVALNIRSIAYKISATFIGPAPLPPSLSWSSSSSAAESQPECRP